MWSIRPQSVRPSAAAGVVVGKLGTATVTPKEMVDLSVAINAINGWNRLAVGFRKMPEA